LRALALRGRRIVFIGGKGGVGKTTTAAALALTAVEEGNRVLLVSTDPAHSLGDLFDARIGNRARELHPNLWALEIDPEEEVERYLEGVKATMRDFVRPAMYPEIERQIELTRQSPGATEAALMERMARIMGEGEGAYDQVIFDTAPTGHTLRLLSLPEIMTAWMDGLLRSRDRSDSFGSALKRLTGGEGVPPGWAGPKHAEGEGEAQGHPHPEEEPEARAPTPDELSWFQEADEGPADARGRKIRELLMERRRTFSQARRLLLDPSTTAFVMVLIPEKLPVLETEKSVAVLEAHRVPIAGVIVNRVLPDAPLGEFLESRRAQEAEYLGRIDRLFRHLNQVRVPLLRRDVQGIEGLREVGRYLPVG
jgi:arsenite/tail-anchored protein-transporting ATPase